MAEHNREALKQYMEHTGGSYCACVVGSNGYDGGYYEVKYDVMNCIRQAQQIYERVLMLPKADLERNKARILLELAHNRAASKNFAYESQKLLYQIKAHPATRSRYARCCEYLHRFYTEEKPPNVKYEEWVKSRLTEKQVLSYLWRALRDSGNGILLCTQQSLPSSVNFEYVNKILIPEMHCNNSGMSQFYMRFIRYERMRIMNSELLDFAKKKTPRACLKNKYCTSRK